MIDFSKSLFGFGFLILMLTSPILLMVNDWYLDFEYSRIEYSSKFSKEERLYLSKEVLDFIKGKNEYLPIEAEFNKREIIHLKDVRENFHKIKSAWAISLILTLSFLLTDFKLYINYIKSLSYIFMALVLLVALGIYLNFNYFFIKFHELVFPHGFWSFEPDDTLIHLYPEKFWFHSIVIFSIFCFLEGILIIFILFIQKTNRNLK